MRQTKLAQTARENTAGAGNPVVEFLKKYGSDIAAYGGLVLTLIIFIIYGGNRLAYKFSAVLQAAASLSIFSMGAMFIYSMGFMDVSVSAQVGVYAIMMVVIGKQVGGWPGVLLGFGCVLALAMLCGAINGYVSVLLNLPSIVTSLFLMFFFSGAQLLLSERYSDGGSISLGMSLKPASTTTYNLILIGAIILVAIVTTYLFNYTRLGKYTRAIGANKTVAEQSGVNTTKWKLLAYMVFGACVAIGSLVMITRTASASKGTGEGYAMDIMICLILGGMPLSGGMKSKIRCALIGSFTYVLLDNDLTAMGMDLNTKPFAKAIIFLIIVLITCRKKDGVLPR